MKKEIMSTLKALTENKKAVAAFKGVSTAAVAGIVAMAYSTGVFAGAEMDGVVNPIVSLINSFINPLMALVGAGGVLFCIILGVKYATAEEPQEREKRKQALKTAIIGSVLIFVLIVALKLSIGPLTDWINNSVANSSTSKITTSN